MTFHEFLGLLFLGQFFTFVFLVSFGGFFGLFDYTMDDEFRIKTVRKIHEK
jgi:uncharacterized membrane protein